MKLKQLGLDYPDYCIEFEAIFESVAQVAFRENPPAMAVFKASIFYWPELRVIAATAGYELAISAAEAMGLMVFAQAYVFRETHGAIKRALWPSIRRQARDHDRMLKSISPAVVHLQRQPIISDFMARMSDHIKKDNERDQ